MPIPSRYPLRHSQHRSGPALAGTAQCERAESVAEIVGHRHAVTLVVDIPPQIVHIMLLADNGVAKHDHVAQVLGHARKPR